MAAADSSIVGAVAMSVDGSSDDEDLADHPAQDGGVLADDLASPVAGNGGHTSSSQSDQEDNGTGTTIVDHTFKK